MSSLFRSLYDNPPCGFISAGDTNPTSTTNTSSTSSLQVTTHNSNPPPDQLPAEIINRSDLPSRLFQWAQAYLDNNIPHQHQPGSQLGNWASLTRLQFGRAQAGNNVGTVASLYARTVEIWAPQFVADVDYIHHEQIGFKECAAGNLKSAGGVCGSGGLWRWIRNGETRMVVELQGKEVFDSSCGGIRDLATADNGSGTALQAFDDASGRAVGAPCILLKLGQQMVAEKCQLGVLFGGQQFLLFAIEDVNRNGETIHQMQCSNILQISRTASSSSSSPDAIQVTIAALLGNKDAFFKANDMAVGFRIDAKDSQSTSGPRRKAAEKKTGSSVSVQSQKRGKAGHGRRGDSATAVSAGITRVLVSYASYRDAKYTYAFERTDTPEAGTGDQEPASHSAHDENTAELILYDPLGAGVSGKVFDADLQRNGRSLQVAAKFYDPDTENMEEEEQEEEQDSEEPSEAGIGTPSMDNQQREDGEEDNIAAPSPEPNSDMKSQIPRLPNEDKEYTFRREIDAYKRLHDSPICPHFYGTFQGEGFTGYQTGVIVTEQLPTMFSEFGEMTEQERHAAYGHVLELHRRRIHHGDVNPSNFGRREVAEEEEESATSASARSKRKKKRKRDASGPEDVRGSVVICDFSHSSVFADCEPEKCWELTWARQEVVEGGIPKT